MSWPGTDSALAAAPPPRPPQPTSAMRSLPRLPTCTAGSERASTEPAATALALARNERRESGGVVRRIAAWYGAAAPGVARGVVFVEWTHGVQEAIEGRDRSDAAGGEQGEVERPEEDEGLRELRPVPRGPATVPPAHHPRAAEVRRSHRARAAGVREVGERLLAQGAEGPGRLRLRGGRLRAVRLHPRLVAEGPARSARRGGAVRAAHQGAQSRRHRRGRVRCAP